jgi:hypothetical protein
MSITDYFKHLQAPLKNSRWSWGAVRDTDQALFLRVWGDEYEARDRTRFYRMTAYDLFEGKPSNLGWLERQEHLKLLQDKGRTAPSYMVICTAVDTRSEPRTIESFDKQSVFRGGELINVHGDWWLEASQRLNVYDVRNPAPVLPK